ncbi:MAG: 6-carboxytetrahydropterin synthase QueD [Psittacicella sp.]
MFTIVKEFSFDAAHLLNAHDGKCKNLHGHTYKLQVEIESNELIESGPKQGMVKDFAEIKEIVKSLVVDKLDHAFLYNKTNASESSIASVLIADNLKVFPFESRTTAEEMSRFIFDKLKNEGKLNIKKVRLWETQGSYCEYY